MKQQDFLALLVYFLGRCIGEIVEKLQIWEYYINIIFCDRSSVIGENDMRKKINKAMYARQKTLQDISDEAWNVERNIYQLMEGLGYFEDTDFMYSEEINESIRLRRVEKCKEFIDAGAGIVLTRGTSPGRASHNSTEIIAITPKATIMMSAQDNSWHFRETKQIHFGDGYKVKFFRERDTNTTTTTYTKDASVVGQAVAGAVIAGPVGAVVGALNANNTNAKGGKTKTSTSVTKTGKFIYTIDTPAGSTLESVYLDTSFMDKYGYPPETFVTKKTKDYWMIGGGSFLRTGFEDPGYELLADYINNAISSYQRELSLFIDGENEKIKNENIEGVKEAFNKKKNAIKNIFGR